MTQALACRAGHDAIATAGPVAAGDGDRNVEVIQVAARNPQGWCGNLQRQRARVVCRHALQPVRQCIESARLVVQAIHQHPNGRRKIAVAHCGQSRRDHAAEIRAGDAVILPRADNHWLGDRPDGVPVPASELYGDTPLSQMPHLLRWGGDGAHTRILCGFLGYERAAFRPLYDALPPMFEVRLGTGGAEPPLDAMLRYAEDEVMAQRPGSSGVRLRLTELLFVESLRRYMANLPPDEAGWLAAVRDPLVGRALALLHAAPRRSWSVELLAREAATSRSSLAERFKQVLGEPPIQYLTRWRMALAARRLRESRDSIATIAEAMGYASPAAFQRAFKRQMDATPAQWRRHGEPDLR